MEESIHLEKELALLKKQYEETKKRAKKYKSEKDKLQDRYVFFHKDQKMKAKNCEKCEKCRYEIKTLCKEAPSIISKIKQLESQSKERKKVFDSYKERFREIEIEKEKIHKKMLYHVAFVEEDVAEEWTLRKYIKDETKQAEWSKAKAQRKRARKIQRRKGTWDKNKDNWYNSDTDSDEETVKRKNNKKMAKELKLEKERWCDEKYDYSEFERKAAVKLQYNHQTVSDEEIDEDMPQDIDDLDCASDLRSKFGAQQMATNRLKQLGSSGMM